MQESIPQGLKPLRCCGTREGQADPTLKRQATRLGKPRSKNKQQQGRTPTHTTLFLALIRVDSEEICWSGSGELLRFRGTFHFCQKEMDGAGGGENSGFAGIFAEFSGWSGAIIACPMDIHRKRTICTCVHR